MTQTPRQLDALSDMIHLGVDRGAVVLESLLDSRVEIRISRTRRQDLADLQTELGVSGSRLSLVMMPFNGLLEGDAGLVISQENARRLVGRLTGKETRSTTFDTLEEGALCEIGNIVLNGVMNTVSGILGASLIYQVPRVHQGEVDMVKPSRGSGGYVAVLADIRLLVGNLEVKGDLVLFFSEKSFAELTGRVDTIILEET